MKKLLITASVVLMPLAQSFGCATCFGDYRALGTPPPPNVQHMAIAIWLLMGIVMLVLAGVGAFSFHLWRHSRAPIQPHELLAEEDLSQYA